jgi:general nucleoside transport system ATP-binding protein
MMVGRPVLFRLEKSDVQIGAPALEVEGLLGEGKLNGISLTVHEREILGVAGVEGNGQRELAEALIGLRTPAVGSIRLAGRDIGGWSVAKIRNAGVGYIPEDRQDQGLVLGMTLWENAVLGREDDAPFAAGWGLLFIQKIKDMAQRIIKLFDVRTRSINVSAGSLSGGNQQKLILARELDTAPKLLTASQPTRGLDVGAIEFVWRQILDQKRAGRAVLLISAELDEIYALSDRIVTIYEGRITGEYPPDAPPERIGIGMLGEADAEEAS